MEKVPIPQKNLKLPECIPKFSVIAKEKPVSVIDRRSDRLRAGVCTHAGADGAKYARIRAPGEEARLGGASVGRRPS